MHPIGWLERIIQRVLNNIVKLEWHVKMLSNIVDKYKQCDNIDNALLYVAYTSPVYPFKKNLTLCNVKKWNLVTYLFQVIKFLSIPFSNLATKYKK